MKKRILILAAVLPLLSACGHREASVDADPMEWTTCHYVDNYGEESSSTYERAIIKGTFSNSAATNAPLTVFITAEKDSTVSIRLAEYDSFFVKDTRVEGTLITNDTIYKFSDYFGQDSYSIFFFPDCDGWRELTSDGKVKVNLTESEYGSSSYWFVIPDGASIRRAIARQNK